MPPMYGNASLQAAGEDPRVTQQQACETLAIVNEETLNCLANSNEVINSVLRKVRGSQPEEKGNTLTTVPERSVLGDARDMRRLAIELASNLNRLSALLS